MNKFLIIHVKFDYPETTKFREKMKLIAGIYTGKFRDVSKSYHRHN